MRLGALAALLLLVALTGTAQALANLPDNWTGLRPSGVLTVAHYNTSIGGAVGGGCNTDPPGTCVGTNWSVAGTDDAQSIWVGKGNSDWNLSYNVLINNSLAAAVATQAITNTPTATPGAGGFSGIFLYWCPTPGCGNAVYIYKSPGFTICGPGGGIGTAALNTNYTVYIMNGSLNNSMGFRIYAGSVLTGEQWCAPPAGMQSNYLRFGSRDAVGGGTSGNSSNWQDANLTDPAGSGTLSTDLIFPANNSQISGTTANLSVASHYNDAGNNSSTLNVSFFILNSSNDLNISNSTLFQSNLSVGNNTTQSAFYNTSFGVRICWFVRASNTTAGITNNSSIFCFTTPGGVSVYFEHSPGTPVSSNLSNVSISNSTAIVYRDVGNAVLNLSGVNLSETVSLTFPDNSSFYTRRVYVRQGIQSVAGFWLLSKTVDSISNVFLVNDFTRGDFTGSNVYLLLYRTLAGSSRLVTSGALGIGNTFSAILQFGACYDVFLLNNMETRSLGVYCAGQSGTTNLNVGFVSFQYNVFAPGEWVNTSLVANATRAENGTITSATVMVTYNDSRANTSFVNISILNAANYSQIYTTNATTGTPRVVFTYYFNLSNFSATVLARTRFVAVINYSSSGTIGARQHPFDFGLATTPTLDIAGAFGVPQAYLTLVGLFLLVAIGLTFSFVYADAAGFMISGFATVFWMLGIFPGGVRLEIVILMFALSALGAISLRKLRGEEAV